MLTGKELSRMVEERFSDFVYELTGVALDYRQTKLIMDAAVKIPLRTALETAKNEKVGFEEVAIATAFGKVSLKSRELKTGGIGEEKKEVLDENGNPIMKWYPKITLSKGTREEIAIATGFNDDEMSSRVDERLEKEKEYVDDYVAGTREWEKYTVEDAFVEEMKAMFKKFSKRELGIDPTKVYASAEYNEKGTAGKSKEDVNVDNDEELEPSDSETDELEETKNNEDEEIDEDLE